MRVIIAGGRDCNDYELLLKAVKASKFPIDKVISGTAIGADKLGERFARNTNLNLERYPAQWKLHGKAAGPIRNKLMAENADALIALWDGQSKGTLNMINTAVKLNLPVHVEYYNFLQDSLF